MLSSAPNSPAFPHLNHTSLPPPKHFPSSPMPARLPRSKLSSVTEKRLRRMLSADETFRLAAYARALKLRRNQQQRIYKPRSVIPLTVNTSECFADDGFAYTGWSCGMTETTRSSPPCSSSRACARRMCPSTSSTVGSSSVVNVVRIRSPMLRPMMSTTKTKPETDPSLPWVSRSAVFCKFASSSTASSVVSLLFPLGVQ